MQFRKDRVTKGCKVMGVFVPICSKITEKDTKFTFQLIVKKASCFVHFDD